MPDSRDSVRQRWSSAAVSGCSRSGHNDPGDQCRRRHRQRLGTAPSKWRPRACGSAGSMAGVVPLGERPLDRRGPRVERRRSDSHAYENPDGSVWAGTAATGLLRLTFATTPRSGEPRPAVASALGVADGIGEGGVGVMRIGDTPAFTRYGSTHDRVMLGYDTSKGAFVVDHSFDGVARDPLQSGFGVVNGPDGILIADFGKGPAILTRATDGSWSVDRSTLARFGVQNGTPPLVEPDRVVWLTRMTRWSESSWGEPRRGGSSVLAARAPGHGESGSRLYAGNTAMPAPRLRARTTRSGSSSPRPPSPTKRRPCTRPASTGSTGLVAWTNESRRDYTNLRSVTIASGSARATTRPGQR